MLAFDRAGDPDWYPELGEPFQPSKLYYSAWSRARMLAIHETLLRRDGKSPFDEKWFERPDNDHRITTRIDVGEFQFARSASLRAHATQVDPTEAWWFGLDDAELAEVYPWEDWILARSLVGPIPTDDSERDLFAGVRESVVERAAVDDARSSTGSSSARRTRSSTGPTTPTSSSPCRSPTCRPTASTRPSPTCRAS